MPPSSLPESATRRRELGAFLRSRRERLSPAQTGLPASIRRRTPGLRREEVAQLAGIGTTWYTWLEQGRDVSPSIEALSALADALKLDAAERQHLFLLSDRPVPAPTAAGAEQVDAPLRRMLDSMETQPAYVLGRRWDVLAWNRAAQALFGDYDRLQGDQRNIMHLVFADPAHRRLLLDWEQLAPSALAMFRADSARHIGDPGFARLIDTLAQASPEFRQWWPKQDVLRPFDGHKRIQHPEAGRMTFEYTTLEVADRPGMKLVVYTPLDEDGTAQKLRELRSATACAADRL